MDRKPFPDKDTTKEKEEIDRKHSPKRDRERENKRKGRDGQKSDPDVTHLMVPASYVSNGSPQLSKQAHRIERKIQNIVGALGTRGRKSKDSAQIHRGQVRARGTRRRQKYAQN